MAIASMVCGIVGWLGMFISGIRIVYLQQMIEEMDNVLLSLYGNIVENQLFIMEIFAFISFVLILLAFIFGIIERKKGKEYIYRRMATAGFVLGLIGLIVPSGIIIFITGSVITLNIANKGGKSQLIVSEPTPYMGNRPEYSYFTGIGSITTKTRDTTKNYSVTVDMIIGYDHNDPDTQSELSNRQSELRDFVKIFFENKYAADLSPEEETILKETIIKELNTSFFEVAKIRAILFTKLDVMELF